LCFVTRKLSGVFVRFRAPLVPQCRGGWVLPGNRLAKIPHVDTSRPIRLAHALCRTVDQCHVSPRTRLVAVGLPVPNTIFAHRSMSRRQMSRHTSATGRALEAPLTLLLDTGRHCAPRESCPSDAKRAVGGSRAGAYRRCDDSGGL
jgi:hypothetical protein